MICVDNTCEGTGCAYSRAQSLTTAHTVLETCGCTHERARTLSRHSYTLKSRTGDMSMMDSVILFLQSTPGKMLRVVVGLVVIGIGILYHSEYSQVCGGSHRAHPDIRSICRDMSHCPPLWVYIRGTEARETRETGKLVMGTCLHLVMASCAAFTCAPDLFPVQNDTAATQRPHSSCSLKCTPTHPLPPTKAGRTD